MKKRLSLLLILVLTLSLLAPAASAQESAVPGDNVSLRRALLIGNNDYGGDGSSNLRGCINDMSRIAKLLGTSSDEGLTYARIEQNTNQTTEDILALIDQAAAEWLIDEDDVTVFYYSGHGINTLFNPEDDDAAMPSPAQSGLCGTDMSLLSFDQLESHLSRLPGTVVVMLDSCFSGALIGKGAQARAYDAYNELAISAFSGSKARGTATTPKYQVLVASSGIEPSLETLDAGSNAGKFTSTLVGGLGMNYRTMAPLKKMAADKNGNRVVTIAEAYDYTRGMISPAEYQSVQMYSDTPSFSLFARTNAPTLALSRTALALDGYGASAQLSALSGGTPIHATWRTSNPRVATVSNDGLVTATGAGKAQITAASGKVKATCAVSVQAFSAEKLLTNATLSLVPGETKSLSVAFMPENATNRTLKYASDNKKVATIDKDGVIKAIASGTATVTAKGAGLSAQCVLTVGESIPVTGITLDDTSIWLLSKNPKSALLPINIEPANASNQRVSVTSTNKAIASAKIITQNGRQYVSVTPKNGGNVQINLRTADGDFSFPLTVNVHDSIPLPTTWVDDILHGSSPYQPNVYAGLTSLSFAGDSLCFDCLFLNYTAQPIVGMKDLRLGLYNVAGLEENEYPYTFDRFVVQITRDNLKMTSPLLPRQFRTFTFKVPVSSLAVRDLGRLDEMQLLSALLNLNVAAKDGSSMHITRQK
ncbi:MAG: Ig-like domain-containing protein [Clostridia bacterium]